MNVYVLIMFTTFSVNSGVHLPHYTILPPVVLLQLLQCSEPQHLFSKMAASAPRKLLILETS